MPILSLKKRAGVYFCGKCDWRVDDQETPWRSTCPRCEEIKNDTWRPIMVGDLVEKALTTVGITKSLVQKVTRTEGKPGGCGCAKRQKWLNDAGVKVQVAARSALLKAKAHYLP